MPGRRSIYTLALASSVTLAAAAVLAETRNPSQNPPPTPMPSPTPVPAPAPDPDPVPAPAASRLVKLDPPAIPDQTPLQPWFNGQRSSPGEREAIDQDLSPRDVDATKLVSVRELVAGADPMTVTDGRSDDERWLVSPEVAHAMADLVDLVHERLGPTTEIWLNGAYDSSRRAHHRNSMHYTGRAVDLDLYSGGQKLEDQVGTLAALASQAFAMQGLHFWVQDEGNHVHASLESPSLTSGTPH